MDIADHVTELPPPVAIATHAAEPASTVHGGDVPASLVAQYRAIRAELAGTDKAPGPDAAPLAELDDSALPGRWANRYRWHVNGRSQLVTAGDTQWFLGYDDKGMPSVTRRRLPNGAWITPVDIDHALGSGRADPDSHNTTAIGVAGNGAVFAVADHHVDPLHIAVSRDGKLDEFKAYPRDRVGLRDTDRVTYPSFVTDSRGQLYFSYREQEVGGGRPRFRWLVKRYLARTDRWETVGELNRGVHLRLYVSHPNIDDRDHLHVTATWRDDSPERTQDTDGSGALRQHDLFHLAFDPDARHWYQIGVGGEPARVQPPFLWDPATQTSDVPFNLWDTPPDPAPPGAGSVLVDRHGTIHVLAEDRTHGGFRHHRLREGEERWRVDRLALEARNGELIPLGDGAGLVVQSDDDIDVYRLPLGTPPVRLVTDAVSRDYHVTIDREGLRDSMLSILVVANGHAAPRETDELQPMPMRVVTVPLPVLDARL